MVLCHCKLARRGRGRGDGWQRVQAVRGSLRRLRELCYLYG